MDYINFAAAAYYPSPGYTPTTERTQPPAYTDIHYNNDHTPTRVKTTNVAQHFLNLGAKRHRRILRDNLPAALNKPTIRRLARRGGVKRIKSEIYETVRQVMKARLREIIEKSIELVTLRHAKTLTALDVVYALRVMRNPIYGYGTIVHGDSVGSNAEYMRKRREGYARNVRETRERMEREVREREIDERVRRLGGTVNLRRL